MKNLIAVYLKSLVPFTFLYMLLCPIITMAQTENENDRTGVLPSQMYDTRSLSMGNATIADVYGRASIGINPALPGLYTNSRFIQYHANHNWDSNFMQHSLTLPILSTTYHHIAVRLGFVHQGFGFLPFTTSSSIPEPDVNMYRAEIAYAVAFSNNFSLGVLQSTTFSTNNEEAQYWNYTADIGLVYAPDSPVSYGLVFRGLGHVTEYEIIETGQTTLNSRLAQQILEVGATLRFPLEDRTYMSMSFSNEKRFGESGLWYKGGLEIIPVPIISFRGGTMINFTRSKLIPRIGMGINTRPLDIDYAIAPNDWNGELFHQIGLTLQF